MVSELFDAGAWREIEGFGDLTDVTYHQHADGGIVRIAIDRPEVRIRFRPRTVDGSTARSTTPAADRRSASCCPLATAAPRTGCGRSARGDQRIKAGGGYEYEESEVG